MLRNSILSSLSVAIISLSSWTWAEGANTFYVGGEVNHASMELEQEEDFFNDSNTGYGVFAGYYVTPEIAFELGYKDFGDFEEKYLSGEVLDADLTVTTLAMKLDLPISGGWGFNMSLGYGDYSSDIAITSAVGRKSEFNVDAEGYFGGLGVSYDVIAGMALGLSYEYHVFEEDDPNAREAIDGTVSKVTVNARYKF